MRRRRDPAAADDATVIESSWRDPERFAVLFDRHAPHINRYLARRADRQVADDLVAETFLAAFTKRDRYDLSYADARPWLYGIAADQAEDVADEVDRRLVGRLPLVPHVFLDPTQVPSGSQPASPG